VPAHPGNDDAAFEAIIAGSGFARYASTPQGSTPHVSTPQGSTPHASTPEGSTGSEDAAAATRRRMHGFLRRLGDIGATPATISHLLASEDTPVPAQTLSRWLAEDEAAGLVERGTLGRWRYKA
jgi:hypothetical protein